MSKIEQMNEHAKYAYWYMSRGHKKELGVNIKLYQNIIRYSLWILHFLVFMILIISIVGWVIIPWITDLMEEIPLSYERHLRNKGIIYDKHQAINKINKDKRYSTESRKYEWVITVDNVIPIHLSTAGTFDLITVYNHNKWIKYTQLGLSDQEIKRVSDSIGLDVGNGYNLDVSLTKYELDSKEQYVKFSYSYVDPEYWRTEYGKKLLQMRKYFSPIEYEKYVNRDVDSWNKLGVGFGVLGFYKSDLTVTVYA
ncbi:hypothetical protein RND61_15585 [Streptomyces sp. TRM76323]|uniref:Uncharacterized protein n=1 Tax=Streptomyces tamarix TaxID=3078565 RepID=A0ABU3QL13_9ACTN|nr:hypothetical protein [Streptomyces tamarix]MDT9683470.1 hypothetical protein [Streptomyces tamarix]